MGARKPPDGAEMIQGLLQDMSSEEGTHWGVHVEIDGEVLLHETGSEYNNLPVVQQGSERQRVSKSFSGFDSQQLFDGRWVSFATATTTSLNANDGPDGHAEAVEKIVDRTFRQARYPKSDGTPTCLFEYLWDWVEQRIDTERNRPVSG